MNSLNDIWQLVIRYLAAHGVSDTAIKTWFDDCKPIEMDEDRFVIHTANSFKRNIISERFVEMIKDCLKELLSGDYDIEILAGDEIKDYIITEKEDNSLPETAGYTFDRFTVGESNRFAHAAAMAVAEKPGQVYNPLFIYGNSGLGKTHLLLSIGQHIHQKSPTKRIVYIKGDEFTNNMVRSIRNGTAEEFRTKYRNADLFLVDDIQFIAGRPQTQEEFFHTFNNIYEAGHQIVVTSDRPPKEMSLLDDRLRTRFEWGLMADIQPPDMETRMAITRNKASQLGLMLSDAAVVYIAEKITANIRQLEGVIKKLTAYKEILDEVITIESVQRAINDVIRDGEFIPKSDDIIRECAHYYQIEDKDIIGQSRSAKPTMARQVAMYLMRSLTNMSLKEIGASCGDRNHTTVLSSIKKIEESIKTSHEMAATVRDITSNLNNSQ